MGNEINSEGSENRAYVTVDGKYFFFTSTISGNRDIYWMDAGIIAHLELTFMADGHLLLLKVSNRNS